jgi:putative mRNA 3-end processing factor
VGVNISSAFKEPLLRNTDKGLFCPAGNFYIDPWEPVDRALITHGHSDHARLGSKHYLTAKSGVGVLKTRLGDTIQVQGLAYGERLVHQGVTISFHPAGHVLGSAQIRLEHDGEIWVVTGDYKRQPDVTCAPFELVPCHTFITESTFGLPIYRWDATPDLFADIMDWWRQNQEQNRTSVLYSYALGKAQRLLGGITDPIGPIVLHGAVDRFTETYRAAGIKLPPTTRAETGSKEFAGKALVIAPPSADGTPWLRKFGEISTAFASGWMQIRGARRRRALDRGFVVSDHVDWPALMQTIKETGASKIFVTHGYTGPVVRWLRENGWEAEALKTRFEGEIEEKPEIAAVLEKPAPDPLTHPDEAS